MRCGLNWTPTNTPRIARPTAPTFRDGRLPEKAAIFHDASPDAGDESAERAAGFLKTIAHPGRLRIICALIERELSVSELARQSHCRRPRYRSRPPSSRLTN